MYKPDGYTSLAPYLIVDDVQPLLAFIKAVFDVEPHATHTGPDGSILHAEAWIDDTVLMFGQMKGADRAAHLHVYVRDVHASFERARHAGAEVIQEPVRKGDPDLRGGVMDGSGTTWWLSTRQQD